MQRHQLRIAEAAYQARQQGLLDPGAGRHHWQEVRLVDHQQVLVGMQHAFLEGDRRLLRHLAEIVDAQADPVGMRGVERRAVAVQHPAALHACQPGGAVDGREMLAQAVEHRGPGALRQVQGTRTHDGAGRRKGHGDTRAAGWMH
ncbi:hypothetical protein D3C75_819240 [compost metagenome]